MIKVHKSNRPSSKLATLLSRGNKEIAAHYALSSSERIQRRIEPKRPILMDCLPSLIQEFSAKCVYCEQPVDPGNYAVDLFRPFSGSKNFKSFSADHYGWLVYEWRNMYLSCGECSRLKENWFPVTGKRAKVGSSFDEVLKEKNLLVDPCNDEPEKHITFDNFGKAKPITKKGKITIDILKLNRPDLLSQRMIVVKNTRQVFSRRRFINKGFVRKVLEILSDNSNVPFAGQRRAILYREVRRNPVFRKHMMRILPKKIPAASYNKLIRIGNIPFGFRTIRKEVAFSPQVDKVLISKIHVRNFKGIRNLRIEFPEVPVEINDKEVIPNEPWLMLLGENGVGKSSLLQAITLCLAGKRYLDETKLPVDQYLNKKAKKGHVKIYHLGSREPYTLQLTRGNTGFTSGHQETPTYILGYGSTRLSATSNEVTGENKQIQVKNLFDPATTLADPSKWIKDLWSKARTQKKQKELFNWVGIAVKDLLLLNPKAKLIIEKDKVMIKHSTSDKEELDQMSDGYRSVVILAIDIIKNLIKEGTTMETAQGIVLIDEIGTHLHPRWKMQVVHRLRKVFPKIQFIVTTHDPLCLRGMQKGEVVVFSKTARNKVQLLKDLPDPSGFNAEQLLGSEFFGLNSTYDWEDELKFNEYYYLVSRKKLNALQSKRKEDLEEFVQEKRQVGKSQYEVLLNKVINEELAKAKIVEPKTTIELTSATLAKVKQIWNP